MNEISSLGQLTEPVKQSGIRTSNQNTASKYYCIAISCLIGGKI
ncbi:MAG: hypothetical protein Q8M98_05400 [Candidatus Cloacimonadaceae bacterium]|nr:hypothetical protein [Candidatus Cloacimonadaceae bacterium]MDP3114197.1 hypothetical protein [Candidatus Cloacimonadaceae bacterium]